MESNVTGTTSTCSVFVVYPVGRYYVEDGLPAAGAGGFGASPRGTPDSAGFGHHPQRNRGSGSPTGSGSCPNCYWREEPALCQLEADLALGRGTIEEEEAV